MQIFSKINWVDVLVIIIMLRMSYIAFQEGLSREIFPLIASVCTIVLSLQYYTRLAIFLSKNAFNLPIALTSFLSFTALVICLSIVFKFTIVVLDKIIKVTWHPLLDRFGGLIFGIARASVIASMILIIIALIPLSYPKHSIKDRSLTGVYFLSVGPVIYERVSFIFPKTKGEGISTNSNDIVKGIIAEKPEPAKEEKAKAKTSEWQKALR